MKLFRISFCFLFSFAATGYAQNPAVIKGSIANYTNQPIYIYKCGVYPAIGGSDTLLLVDSVKTDAQGKFVFSFTDHRLPVTLSLPVVSGSRTIEGTNYPVGIYRFNLPHNQWFYILNDGKPVEMKTQYQHNAFYNIATDSLKVIKSDENKRFYEFQHLQQKLNVANYWLLQMMRLYPLPDPFHKTLEAEYLNRYKAMARLVKPLHATSPNSLSTKLALAYYQPANPDWKQPDPWRDSIIVAHYFDYFNPADSFYLHTNILPEKMDLFLTLSTNKRDAYGQPVNDEMLYAKAAQVFLDTLIATPNSNITSDFCLNYLLKKFNKEHKETVFLYLCDQYLKHKEGDCGAEKDQFNWARERAGKLRNIAIGSTAPDFVIEKGTLRLSSLQSDYTLLLFWATWCPHCTQVVPEIKKVTDEFNQREMTMNDNRMTNNLITNSQMTLLTVAISLDTDNTQWQKFVTENNLLSFLNFSELKGWKGEVSKQYNVYATPTMFLLDKDKKIIAKPLNAGELKQLLDVISKK